MAGNRGGGRGGGMTMPRLSKTNRPPRLVGTGVPLWRVRLDKRTREYNATHTNERGEIIIEID